MGMLCASAMTPAFIVDADRCASETAKLLARNRKSIYHEDQRGERDLMSRFILFMFLNKCRRVFRNEASIGDISACLHGNRVTKLFWRPLISLAISRIDGYCILRQHYRDSFMLRFNGDEAGLLADEAGARITWRG